MNHPARTLPQKSYRLRHWSGIPIDPTTSSLPLLGSVPSSCPQEPAGWMMQRSLTLCSLRLRPAKRGGTLLQILAPPRPSRGYPFENTRNLQLRQSVHSGASPDPSPSFAPTRTFPPSSGTGRATTSPPSPPRPARPPSSSTSSPRRRRSSPLASPKGARRSWRASTPRSPSCSWRPRSTSGCITW